MAVSFNDWETRAREHLAADRVIDALSCFRKAARLRPRAREPFSGIAESLWRLGKAREAIAAWREAATRGPDFLPTWQAIAEAATFVGDDATASQAATRVLATLPADERARFTDACAQLADVARRDAGCATLVELIASSSWVIRRPHMGQALARALATCGADDCAALRSALAARAARSDSIAVNLDLLAQIARFVPAATLRARIDRVTATDDLDPLRQIALAMSSGVASTPSAPPDDKRAVGNLAGERAGDDAAALAQHAADRYAALSVTRHAAEVPLLWPLRAAGGRARVIVLVDTASPQTVRDDTWQALVAALQPLASRIDLAFAAFGDAQRIVERLQATPLVAARVTQMPAQPDIESARALAGGDPDLLIDVTGVSRATGPLFAARPARRIVGTATSPHLTPPLVDALLPADPGAWPAAIAALVTEAVAMPASASTPAQMHAQLAAAIDAHRARQDADASARYDTILREHPGHVPTLHLRGALRRDMDDRTGAAADFAAALAIAPRDAKSRVALAQLALSEYRAADARALLEQGLVTHVPDITILRALGHAALALRDGAAAVNAFANALALDPFDAETHFNHGVALQMQRHVREAARAYHRALDIEPSLLDAHFNLGVVFDQLGQTDSAIAALEYVLKRQPGRATPHRTLLDILSRSERGAEWMRAFERFERNCPDALGLVANALEYYQYQGDYAKVHRYVERLSRDEFKPANELDLVDSLEQLLYLMLFFDIEPGAQASLYSTYDLAARRVYGEALPRRPSRRPGPIRIGYLSADLRDHVMGKMMLPVIREHDATRFSVHLYSTAEVEAEDAITAEFRAAADTFVSLAGVADIDAVRQIAEADLDILVDLSTHTRGSRPAIVARKPARVQITHVASAGALGMSAVDFKLTDHFADLPESDDMLVETLLPMQGCVYPFRRIAPATGHSYQRAAFGIAADAVVFGAFVNPLKLSRRTMALWKEILDKLPDARLAFSPNIAWLASAYPRILAKAGIDPARAVMLPPGHDDAHNLARYAIVDAVLDPMPFGNVNGTIEPLNMGVPVVTFCERTHGERSSYSILTNLGVTSTIARSGREYVDIAVRLASDKAFSAQVRHDIAARLDDSPVTDMKRYARHLEAAYDQALALASQREAKGEPA